MYNSKFNSLRDLARHATTPLASGHINNLLKLSFGLLLRSLAGTAFKFLRLITLLLGQDVSTSRHYNHLLFTNK